MKIAIIGTHSTGKTTLIEKLQNKLRAHAIPSALVPEVARVCPLPINEASTVPAQTWILDKQIAAENELDHLGQVVICDRASIDNWAYFYRALSRNGCVIAGNAWEQKAVRQATTYDFIFKTQMLSLAAKADARRSTDGVFRQEMDELITAILHEHNINHHLLLPTTDYDAQVEFILSFILPIFSDQSPSTAVPDSRSIR